VPVGPIELLSPTLHHVFKDVGNSQARGAVNASADLSSFTQSIWLTIFPGVSRREEINAFRNIRAFKNTIARHWLALTSAIDRLDLHIAYSSIEKELSVDQESRNLRAAQLLPQLISLRTELDAALDAWEEEIEPTEEFLLLSPVTGFQERYAHVRGYDDIEIRELVERVKVWQDSEVATNSLGNLKLLQLGRRAGALCTEAEGLLGCVGHTGVFTQEGSDAVGDVVNLTARRPFRRPGRREDRDW
jgi:hypothetical protein